MLDRPLAAFDIETVPDADVGRRVFGLEGSDEEVVRRMYADRLEETEGTTGYPQLPHHRVITICVAWLDPQRGRCKIAAIGGEARDERSHLEAFAGLFRGGGNAPRLVSWNGNGFDLPVIRYRSMLRGVAAPELYRTDGDWKWNNYQNRFHDMHVDLMDVLAGYGASYRVGLGLVAELLGLPGKSFLEREVWEHFLAGDEELIVEYCKMDVVLTLLVYLAWETHCGALAVEEMRRHVTTVRETLAAEGFDGWREMVAGLDGWPRWG